jgi:hypothetical protein
MYFNEHGPPHFHALYSGHRIAVDIETGAVEGGFPPAALRLVIEWLGLHRAELRNNWVLAQ